MQRIVTRFFSTSLLLVLFSSCVFAASDEYVKKYGTQNFTINQDALKYEIPERGLYKVIPRFQACRAKLSQTAAGPLLRYSRERQSLDLELVSLHLRC